MIISIIDVSYKNKVQMKIIIVEAVTNYEWRITTKIKVGKKHLRSIQRDIKMQNIVDLKNSGKYTTLKVPR